MRTIDREVEGRGRREGGRPTGWLARHREGLSSLGDAALVAQLLEDGAAAEEV